ncbi:hypothetical protein MUK42_05092 [Musa troglodytarum]|uniref:Uncharacterized protein n=1 Tax=Musa troglodytarum TaxID=320322 RepID=A0A9E7ERZ3_9LILI|nr:hypothetical protein MUK42_05092 [Musa troglodytarum]
MASIPSPGNASSSSLKLSSTLLGPLHRLSSRFLLLSLSCSHPMPQGACDTRTPPPRPEEEEEHDPRLPRESFEVPVGRSGGGFSYRIYDREESTKGQTNPKSGQGDSKSRSSYERFSAPRKPPIIGLPAKVQTSGYGGRCIRPSTQGRIFPKKGGRGGGRKSAVPEREPGSPKVSCFGKVGSERERARARRQPEQQRGPVVEPEVRGCCAGFMAILGLGRGGGRRVPEVLVEKSSSPPRRSILEKTVNKASREATTAPYPAGPGSGPGGGMRRFSSGRRAASWGEEAELGAATVGKD